MENVLGSQRPAEPVSSPVPTARPDSPPPSLTGAVGRSLGHPPHPFPVSAQSTSAAGLTENSECVVQLSHPELHR